MRELIISSEPNGKETRWVVALVLLAFLVRWVPALIPHFWYDEIYTVRVIHESAGQILRITAGDAHPPLYYFWVKGFAAVGRRLGGPFATLAWLRLASILPGVLTCLLAWRVVRRCWGRGPALWALGLFAVSPALTYYSVELRNYALTHCLLLAALIALLEAVDPTRARRWRAGFLFAVLMALGLYVHSLVNFYLGAFGAIIAVELALPRADKRKLFLQAGAAMLVIALCYLPWLPLVLKQKDFVNQKAIGFLPWANWGDLPTTLLCYLPLGPLNAACPGKSWPAWLMAPSAVCFFLIGALALRRPCGLRGETLTPKQPSPRQADRLLSYSAALTTLPIMAAFLISHFHIARVFLGYRYNLLAAPFFNLLLLGLLFRIPRPRLRAGLLGLLVIVSAGLSLFMLWQKTVNQNDFRLMAAKDRGLLLPGSRICWTDPDVLPWLSRCGSFTLDSAEDALAKAEIPAGEGDCYFLTHSLVGNFGPLVESSPLVLEKVLERHKAARLDLSDLWEWTNVWRLPQKDLTGRVGRAVALPLVKPDVRISRIRLS